MGMKWYLHIHSRPLKMMDILGDYTFPMVAWQVANFKTLVSVYKLVELSDRGDQLWKKRAIDVQFLPIGIKLSSKAEPWNITQVLGIGA
ncbi:hypothetical protein E2562_038132 [Oryza meyeriana var. granulata]|uniref:Uncharacterized protein n=1 Tax=Oryza meyeriana var. granulata TaxID=110450 RepID=A0A6G1DUC4_9ORYZ|nr:hypothetical protein E2562_038132 [Oryza meyeriana var. granulata]